MHIQLASAAFIGVRAGTWFYLLAARAAPALPVLCLDCGVALWALAGAVGGRSHSDLHDPGTLETDD